VGDDWCCGQVPSIGRLTVAIYGELLIGYDPGVCVAYPAQVLDISVVNIVSTNPIVKWLYYFGSGLVTKFDATPAQTTAYGGGGCYGCESLSVYIEDSLGNTYECFDADGYSVIRSQSQDVFTGLVPSPVASIGVPLNGVMQSGVAAQFAAFGCYGPCFSCNTNPYIWGSSIWTDGINFETTASVVPGGMFLQTTATLEVPLVEGSSFAAFGISTSGDAVPPWTQASQISSPSLAVTIFSTASSFTSLGPVPEGFGWSNDSPIAAGETIVFSGTIPTVYPVHSLVVFFGSENGPGVESTSISGALIPPFQSVLTPTCLPGATLGVGDDLQILLLTRGGGSVIAELNPVSGSFTRDVDATSTLEMTGVTSGLLGESCCDNWDEVYPWNTEIIVYRDGRDAWCGPVTGVEFGYGTVKVTAADLTAWWDRRVLPANLNFVNVDISTIFESVATAAMSTDPVANFNITTTPTGILGTRTYLQTDYKYASDLLSELAKTGIDYSAYGRTILCGGEQVPADPYVVLTDEFWVQPPTVSARGNDQATQVIVLGKGVTGIATSTTPYTDFYGLLVRTFSETEIEDAASAQAAANTRLALLQDQLYIEAGTGGGLKPTAPITLPELIPGIRVRVDSSASCRQVVADFRLKSVKVGFDGSVAIDLQPLGTVGT
jgi:hypothetical protein